MFFFSFLRAVFHLPRGLFYVFLLCRRRGLTTKQHKGITKIGEEKQLQPPTGQREMDVIDYNKLERILVIYVMVLMAPDALRCLSLRSFFVILSFGTSIE